MKQQDKLRDTLREHYDNQPADLSAADWEKASALLDAGRNKKMFRRSAIILIPLLFAGAALFIYNSPGATDTFAQMPAINQTTAPTQGMKENGEAEFTGSQISEVTNSGSSPKNNTSQPTASNPQNNPDLPKDKSLTGLGSEDVRPVHAVSSTSSPEKKDMQVKISSVSQATGASPIAVNVMVPGSSSAKISGRKKNKEAPAVVNESVSNYHEQTAMPTVEKKEPGGDAANAAEITEVQGEDDKAPKTDSSAIDQPVAEVMKAKPEAPALTASTLTTEIKSVVTQTDTLPKYWGREGFLYYAGASWLNGYKGLAGRDARGFSPLAGISYMNQLDEHSSLSFGFQYFQVRKLSNASRTSRVTSFVYGEQSNVTIITPSTLHYLVLPLQYSYFINRRNSFAIGVNLAYLLNVDASVTTHDEKPGTSNNYKTFKQGGYTEGFNWFDSQVSVAYTRRFNPYLGLQAEIFIGLKDVKQDQFFGYNGKEKNTGAKLSLVYYAFGKKH